MPEVAERPPLYRGGSSWYGTEFLQNEITLLEENDAMAWKESFYPITNLQDERLGKPFFIDMENAVGPAILEVILERQLTEEPFLVGLLDTNAIEIDIFLRSTAPEVPYPEAFPEVLGGETGWSVIGGTLDAPEQATDMQVVRPHLAMADFSGVNAPDRLLIALGRQTYDGGPEVLRIGRLVVCLLRQFPWPPQYPFDESMQYEHERAETEYGERWIYEKNARRELEVTFDGADYPGYKQVRRLFTTVRQDARPWILVPNASTGARVDPRYVRFSDDLQPRLVQANSPTGAGARYTVDMRLTEEPLGYWDEEG